MLMVLPNTATEHTPPTADIMGDTRITRPTVDMVTQLMDGIPQRHTLGRTPTGIRRPHIPG